MPPALEIIPEVINGITAESLTAFRAMFRRLSKKPYSNQFVSVMSNVTDDYDNSTFNLDINNIVDSSNDLSKNQQQQQEQQEQQEIKGPHWPVEMSEEEIAKLCSLDMLEELKKGIIPDIEYYYDMGARFDLQDSDTGIAALHIMASKGWRQGVQVALRDKGRCNFLLRDNRNMLASAHALIYGRDHALMRLLQYLEIRSGVGFHPKDDRPRPLSFGPA